MQISMKSQMLEQQFNILGRYTSHVMCTYGYICTFLNFENRSSSFVHQTIFISCRITTQILKHLCIVNDEL
jgi:hypothetical protein